MTFRPAPRALATATAALLALTGVAACSTDDSPAGADPERVDVVAGFYPLQFLAEQIGGDAVAVTNLARPGAEPHDLELNPGQVGQISEAELVLFLDGFQPAVDEAVEQNAGDRAFDVAGVQPLLDAAAGGHDHGGEHADEDEHGHDEEEAHAEEEPAEGESGAKDPHVWLDPTRLATIGDKLAERLGAVDPDRAGDYTQRATALRTELEKLDAEFTEGLKTCQRREIVVSHAAFGYLTQKYQLEQIGISGLSPEDEPSPQRLAVVAEEAREHQATTIFFETLVSPKVAETIAQEVGAQTAVLDPIEGLSEGNGADYLSVMRTNLQTLRTALSCS
ncbi:zinc transport system substrate-binding protein [Micromonospora phaseoli]|uniref:Zinc transport system substrate-binding protein n=1 Tax=Micromonospora phaseoli TaxID=1144548 RepID=A0A1H7CS23_9ACTN|nr:metal ABC transporter substrate-binding protein [Micromonospora phaseoli]PZV97819.1 zinc transport system substrate-binding protein [Micromonospora phaseoli]GIJ78445.1 zinc ABC transporter substrate-binding protein [Micromonospora phaseoli]SEJ88605.1 zinc transport system substrate-binding protein [Micromonospora phaseoli]